MSPKYLLVIASIIGIISLTSAACQPTLVAGTPESVTALPASLPDTPRPARTLAPPRTSRSIEARPTSDPSATVLIAPFVAAGLPTVAPELLTQVSEPVTQAQPGQRAELFLIGRSVEGRGIMARRFGTGERTLLLVGGVHGGWESNTVLLLNELIVHFEQTPDAVLPGLSLVLIPVLNPDGLGRGEDSDTRFNANGVDLNRNWGCGWQAEAYWRQEQVNAGAMAFSEPETQALAAYIRISPPAAVLFYHSAAGAVYAGECEGDHGSQMLAGILGEAAEYTYGRAFSAYPVTGTAPSWVDGQGIPAADVELESQTETEFERNLSGIMAVQRWLNRAE
ncbi:MAG: hypothetical protein H7175_10915 [Burkholderiales bacterium]|nr:hypothetical protein [Anaerolineae bacterium]